MKRVYIFTAIMVFALWTSCSKESKNQQGLEDHTKSEQKIDWPDLPQQGFVSGRVADMKDVDSGAAAFAATGEIKSEPCKIPVPQYGMYKEKNGTMTPVILIQAEIVHGTKGDVQTYGLKPL